MVEKTPQISDWLGFAGNVLGGGIALVGAAIAWKAVQAQIETQKEQIVLSAVIREADRIKREISVVYKCQEILQEVGTLLPRPDDRRDQSTLITKGLNYPEGFDKIVDWVANRSRADTSDPHVTEVALRLSRLETMLRAGSLFGNSNYHGEIVQAMNGIDEADSEYTSKLKNLLVRSDQLEQRICRTVDSL
ncbi:hypothetical protein D4Q52_14745 [Rhodopseudomonas palustris]|uniref:Uncharacterized protein n=2 Tax=Rhodopseudomonas palustris TaxID=1076 RepID=A0A418V460_RHOPL|nr:hypothetical protein D4Q52_14745 [Rhodopseudomonas palustris]